MLLALGADICVGVLKLAAGLLSGSAALLSEAAHSVGDASTQVLLLVAVHRSERDPDRDHPFGYGKERYFWSLLAAFAIFVSGAGFSIYEGFQTILGPGESSGRLWINYPVLVVAGLFEGTSLAQSVRQMRRQAAQRGRGLLDLVRDPEDPTVTSVAMEDSAALVGLVLAAAGVVAHQLTGSPVWDGVASLLIGGLLLVVACSLVNACRPLVIGQQASPELLREVEEYLESQPEIDDVVDVLSMRVGSYRVLLCVRADFAVSVTSDELERTCVRVDGSLRELHPELGEIFIQPASRDDRQLRRRVEQRYGHAIADPPA